MHERYIGSETVLAQSGSALKELVEEDASQLSEANLPFDDAM